MRFLVVESEKADEREARRRHAGKSSGESYQATLEQMVPGVVVERIAPAEDDERVLPPSGLAAFDAVFLTGAPLHVYDDTPETARQIAFMRSVFRSGTPSFGSCAGLQLATVAAGGTVRPMAKRVEAAVARRIVATVAGRDHPMLAGRPVAWDVAAIHTDEVETLPEGAVCLATNGVTQVQAAEIRYDGGLFWGVQYHPELAPGEIAVAIRRQADDLVEAGLARDRAQVEARAALLDAIHDAPDDVALRWSLGVDGEFAEETGRRRELSNFVAALPHLRGSVVSDHAGKTEVSSSLRIDQRSAAPGGRHLAFTPDAEGYIHPSRRQADVACRGAIGGVVDAAGTGCGGFRDAACRAYPARKSGQGPMSRVTVWHDGGCPLCRREIALMRRLDRRGRIAFVDAAAGDTCPLDRAEMLSRFHAREDGGPLLSGATAFAAMWRAIPLLRPLGEAARNRLVLTLMERLYLRFLRVRPRLQRWLASREVRR